MKMVISPAKSLNFESTLPTQENSNPCFLAEANHINQLLRDKTPSELSHMMKISDKLGNLNWERNQNFNTPFNPENARPAVYTFDGDVYTGLDVYTLPEYKIKLLQNSLRILSGLYGVLKPLDLIQPYRLEMGTKFPVEKNKNLYEFWKQKITSFLNDELEENELSGERRVVIEDPAYPDLRDILNQRTNRITALPVDSGGLMLPKWSFVEKHFEFERSMSR